MAVDVATTSASGHDLGLGEAYIRCEALRGRTHGPHSNIEQIAQSGEDLSVGFLEHGWALVACSLLADRGHPPSSLPTRRHTPLLLPSDSQTG